MRENGHRGNLTNYQKQLDQIIEACVREGRVPSLLLHSCCAPCSSYTIEYLSQYFEITVFYYNPNIYPEEEFSKRVEEQKRLISQMPTRHPVSFIEGTYDPKEFYAVTKGLEQEPEGGLRCTECFRLRLRKTAILSKEKGFDYFTTTLTISPLKDAARLNAIGDEMGEKYGVSFLPSDFKKRGGYQRSIQLSREYDLYRQNYCGCIFSQRETKNETSL